MERYPGSIVVGHAWQYVKQRYARLTGNRSDKPKSAAAARAQAVFFAWEGVILAGVFVAGLGKTTCEAYMEERSGEIARRGELVEQYRERVRQSADTLRSLSESGAFWSAAAQHASERAAVWEARTEVRRLQLQIARARAGMRDTVVQAAQAGPTNEAASTTLQGTQQDVCSVSPATTDVSSSSSSNREGRVQDVWVWMRPYMVRAWRWVTRTPLPPSGVQVEPLGPSPDTSSHLASSQSDSSPASSTSSVSSAPDAAASASRRHSGPMPHTPGTSRSVNDSVAPAVIPASPPPPPNARKRAEPSAVAAAAAALATSAEAAAYWEGWRTRCDGKVREVLAHADEEYHSQFELQQQYRQWQQYEGRVLVWSSSWAWGTFDTAEPEQLQKAGGGADSSMTTALNSSSGSSNTADKAQSSSTSATAGSAKDVAMTRGGDSASASTNSTSTDSSNTSSKGHRWLLHVRVWAPAWLASERDEALEAQVADWLQDLAELAGWVTGWDGGTGPGADGVRRAEVQRDVWIQVLEEEAAAKQGGAAVGGHQAGQRHA